MTWAIVCIFIAFGFCAAQTTGLVCNEPLGVGIGSDPAAILTASSQDYTQNTAEKGRLNSDRQWCATAYDTDPWIQADLGAVKQITGVITQSSANGIQWVEEYKVSYSASWISSTVIKAEYGDDKIFTGNSENNTEVTNTFSPVNARWVRIHPVSWNTPNHPCLRFEVLGCSVDTTTKSIQSTAHIDETTTGLKSTTAGVTTDEKKPTAAEETTAKKTTVEQSEMELTSGVTTDERKATTPEETTAKKTTVGQSGMKSTTSGITTDEKKSTESEAKTTSVESSSWSTDELEMSTEVNDKSTTYKPSDEKEKKYHFGYSNTCNRKEAEMVVNFKKKKKSSKTFRRCGID